MRFHFYLDLFHGAVQKAPHDPAKIAYWGEWRAVASTSQYVCKEATVEIFWAKFWERVRKLRKAKQFAFRHVRPKSEVQSNIQFSFVFL